MRFRHSRRIWAAFPELTCGVLHSGGITADADVAAWLEPLLDAARGRLADGPESGFPEIRAWRRTFAAMGLPPTRYRCAAESLLRRYRREGVLPRLHPLVDLCNAVSLAHAVPVGVFDVDRIDGDLEVRHASGDERYLTFAGGEEHPEQGEVIFADSPGRAHARRWTNRQSGWSAVREGTGEVLVVVEAMHPGADVSAVLAELESTLAAVWSVAARTTMLTAAAPTFEVPTDQPCPRRRSPGRHGDAGAPPADGSGGFGWVDPGPGDAVGGEPRPTAVRPTGLHVPAGHRPGVRARSERNAP
ncbi:B3/B4 domain-containing protein [Micromonospora mirobrigensis]|uniref:B3/B4 domain-containing protein (DNA/RNA-binding domain of Phe-tRNA-synthetase) n=1 Tax=Micromonospora mirobrigensis TaxID=262898 RepID=A0A1C4W5J8_9ACTN|nr:phenylalanine--tRNA ligase beta subunit-related protein [Micromonospora mirobrigensis]SCE91453.1 B3/B4 domain-containing protein (DNA/RNA-binding domain of Phe-tRNA-synthetase) [Micromonospora mirobrigensis]